MAGVRELLAVALGVVLGVGLLAAPKAAIRLSVFMGPHRRRRHGEYGGEDDIPTTWVYVVRALGVACIAIAGVIAYQTFA
ncbi:hypothetical protein [Halobacterium wangiae]|uniref:hypothetical protein n=1 Tax=Halobacterium wangiae TaxID=2902623 RepID=UPI001E28F111|nr:hypothetical protein [Halobacterium wangiae]